MKLDALVSQIQGIDAGLKTAAGRAVNRMLTARNWLIGYYIVHYEQHGEDRAQYGAKLLSQLAKQLSIKGLPAPELSRCRQFFSTYPQILGTLSQEFKNLLPGSILATPSQKLGPADPAELAHSIKLVERLPYSLLVELIKIDDPVKRQFYELLAIRTQPSVRELRRQIGTLAFERVGLSANLETAFAELQQKIIPAGPADIVKSLYVFDFLDLPSGALPKESELEDALLDHIQEFILELGEGFCFEARQKRILISDEYFFIDLVFYHRILKCHVLIDLKVEAFTHHMAGQLNTYLNYYKKEVVPEGDNPPIGILLVTDKNTALVEYATAGMDEGMFVKKYLLQLPKPEVLQAFILDEIKKW